MTIMRQIEVQNIHGETYRLAVRKHTEEEFYNDYGYLYSIRIDNADPKAFDFNTHTFLYDDWQTAYKRLKELAEEYKTIEIRIARDVDGETVMSI